MTVKKLFAEIAVEYSEAKIFRAKKKYTTMNACLSRIKYLIEQYLDSK